MIAMTVTLLIMTLVGGKDDACNVDDDDDKGDASDGEDDDDSHDLRVTAVSMKSPDHIYDGLQSTSGALVAIGGPVSLAVTNGRPAKGCCTQTFFLPPHLSSPHKLKNPKP